MRQRLWLSEGPRTRSGASLVSWETSQPLKGGTATWALDTLRRHGDLSPGPLVEGQGGQDTDKPPQGQESWCPTEVTILSLRLLSPFLMHDVHHSSTDDYSVI